MEGSLILLFVIIKIVGSLIISAIIVSFSNKKFENVFPIVLITLACVLSLFKFAVLYTIIMGIPLFILFKFLISPSQKRNKNINDDKLLHIKELQKKVINKKITEEQFYSIIKHPNFDLLIKIESLNNELNLLQQSYEKKLLTKEEYEKKTKFYYR